MTKIVHSASRVILASPRAVFRALINPEAIVRWKPPKGMTGEITAFDARVEGRYRMELRYAGGRPGKSGPASMSSTGAFLTSFRTS